MASTGAYWLVFGSPKHTAGEPRHVFCGPSGHPCPSCHFPLLRYAELDLSDWRLGQGHGLDGRVELLFCWRCGVSQSPFHYRIGPGGLESLRFGVGPPETDFPYADYPEAFPASALSLVEVPADELRTLAHAREGKMDITDLWLSRPDLVDPRHHVAPAPLFVRDPSGLVCTTCSQPMSFLAGFGDCNLDPRGFVGESTVQVLFYRCGTCQELGAQQVCD